MKTPVQRVGIFFCARRTHFKGTHRGVTAVIGQFVDNSKTRPAIRAVNKGIAIPSVGRVKQLLLTGSAGGKIGRNKRGCIFCTLNRSNYLEIIAGFKHSIKDFHFGNVRCRRGIVMHAHNESIYVGWGAFGVHFHTKGSIQNPALYAKLVGTSIHKGAETHPLYNAFYCYVSCFAHDVFSFLQTRFEFHELPFPAGSPSGKPCFSRGQLSRRQLASRQPFQRRALPLFPRRAMLRRCYRAS